MKVSILIGPSGAGKTTYVRENYADAEYCSADVYFVDPNDCVYRFDASKLQDAHSYCLWSFCEALSNGKDAVVDNTNCNEIDVAPYIAVATAYSAEVDITVFVVDYNDAEKLARRNVHNVPVDVIERMINNENRLLRNWPKRWPAPKRLITLTN